MNINNIISSDLCMSCGACKHVSPEKISIELNAEKGMFLPKCSSPLNKNELDYFEKICPANGYPIKKIATEIFDKPNYEDYRLGTFKSMGTYRINNKKILDNASSGGVLTGLAKKLLDENIVQGVVATSFKYMRNEIVPQVEIITDSDQLYKTQGSKYMPVPALLTIESIKKFNGKVVFIGTPCQIAAIRLIQQYDPIVKEKILFTFGFFCGGFKDMREIDRYKEIAGMSKSEIEYFQFRGSGQPGKMKINSKDGGKWEYSYPEYARLTGYMKYYRCRVCVDATAELADISCGDAWLDKFEKMGGNWSIVIFRNKKLENIFYNLTKNNEISYEPITIDEVVLSQKGNLTSKKERFISRNNFLKIIDRKIPKFDGGWNPNPSTSLLFEAKVYFSQLIIYYLEKTNLYWLVLIARKILKKTS